MISELSGDSTRELAKTPYFTATKEALLQIQTEVLTGFVGMILIKYCSLNDLVILRMALSYNLAVSYHPLLIFVA